MSLLPNLDNPRTRQKFLYALFAGVLVLGGAFCSGLLNPEVQPQTIGERP